jgi:HK97 family phage major capsid protein
VYDAGSPHSYFRDLVFANVKNDVAAMERLREHGKQMIVEKRADITTADPGAASFIPPNYMGAQWIDTAIAGRPFADAVPKIPLPPTGKSMDFPRVQTNPTVAVQVNQADAVNEVDFDAETYTVNKVTIAGQNDVSIQALEFSDPSIDIVIMRELNRSYNQQIDAQLIYGTGANGQHRGIKTVVTSDSGNVRAFASGNGAGLLGGIYGGLSDVATNQPGFEANCILLHPRRAAWLASHRDASGNLFQQGQLFLAAGGQDQGFVGNVAGLRVVRDPNVLTNQGTNTNEDDVYVMDINELMLAEGPLRTRVLQEVLSGTLQVRVQLYAFSAFAGGRRPKVITRISGAGLATPTFPST